MWGSELIAQRPDFFRVIKDPFSGDDVVVVKALRPEWAVIHVQEADIYGNARILGPVFQDVLYTRAARKTIITTEKIVDTAVLRQQPELTSIPHFLVEAVVLAPGGAAPGVSHPGYETVDDGVMKAYIRAVRDGTLTEYLAQATGRGEQA